MTGRIDHRLDNMAEIRNLTMIVRYKMYARKL